MSAHHIILSSLPSLCQKLLKLAEFCGSSDKNNFAQFFGEHGVHLNTYAAFSQFSTLIILY